MKTTYFLITFLITLLFSTTVSTQITKQISEIRAEVAAINKNIKSYDTSTKDLSGFSTEGGEATYYVSGRGLKKITASIYGETFRATVELYYSGEELIFAFRRVNKYDTQIGMTPPPKVVKIEEARLYRSGDKSIRILAGQKSLAPDSTEFEELEKELIETSDHIKMLYHP